MAKNEKTSKASSYFFENEEENVKEEKEQEIVKKGKKMLEDKIKQRAFYISAFLDKEIETAVINAPNIDNKSDFIQKASQYYLQHLEDNDPALKEALETFRKNNR